MQMKRMPRMYAESTLQRMYRSLGWEHEKGEYFQQSFDAAAQFYGIIPLKRLLHIIRKYGETLTDEEFYAFAEIKRHEEHFFCILSEDEIYTEGSSCEPPDRELIEESLALYGFEAYELLRAEQQGKHYYIPPDKEEFLRYADDGYFEKTPQTNAVLRFLKQTLHCRDAEDLLEDLVLVYRTEFDDPVPAFFDELERRKIRMTQMQCQTFLELMTELCNHTRLQHNRGFTPDEMYGRHDPDELPSLPVMPSAPAMPAKVPAKNALCPCGSGKKYKRCCGRS